jgi:hypothetical protein
MTDQQVNRSKQSQKTPRPFSVPEGVVLDNLRDCLQGALDELVTRAYQQFVPDEPGSVAKAAGNSGPNPVFLFLGMLLSGGVPDGSLSWAVGIALGDLPPGQTGQWARVPLGLGADGKDGVLL